jgi:hypothetical protein
VRSVLSCIVLLVPHVKAKAHAIPEEHKLTPSSGCDDS